MLRARAWVTFVVPGVVLFSCHESEGPLPAPPVVAVVAPASPATAVSPAAVSPSFDIGSVVRRAHFAFRPEPGGFAGGHATYEVHTTATATTVTPYRRSDDGSGGVSGTPARFETRHVARRGGESKRAEPTLRRTDEGELRIARGAAEERLANTEDGVEISWAFPAAPAGKGDLVVTLGVSGESFVAETPNGLHFAEPRSPLGVRFGRATWVDARGARAELTPRFANGAIELVVPADLVDSSAFPAILDPTIGPEFGLDAPLSAPPASDQTSPAVAYAGGTYLVVWQDLRGAKADIYGARVQAAGNPATVLDTVGFPISTAPGPQTKPQVSSSGANFFVVWEDGRNVNAANPNNIDIFGSRVTSAGAVVDTAGIAISSAANDQIGPALAYDGSNYFLVAWQDLRTGTDYDLYGARVAAATGVVQDANGIAISAIPQNQTGAAVASDGAQFFVAWDDQRNVNEDIYGARVTAATGAVVDAAGIALCTDSANQSYPAAGYAGGNFLVAWTDARASDNDIYATRVRSAGTLVDAANGFPVSTPTFSQLNATVTSDGTNFFVAWQDARTNTNTFDVYGTRISNGAAPVLLDGVSPATGGIALSTAAGTQVTPSAAYDGANNFVVVWDDGRNGNRDIYGTRVVASSGALVDGPANAGGFIASLAGNTEQNASIATDGTSYFIAWQDFRFLQWDIFGIRVSAAGVPVDVAAIPISVAVNQQIRPQVAYAGGAYLVAWQDRRSGTDDIFGARVVGSVVQDGSTATGGIAISTATGSQASPTVASDGTNFYVAWQDRRLGNDDIFGARVASASGLLGDGPSATGGLAITTAAGAQVLPSAAFGGGSYLIAWQDNVTTEPSTAAPVLARTRVA